MDFERDDWFSDAPVLLDFGGDQVEIDHQKFDDISITWNTVDPTGARRPMSSRPEVLALARPTRATAGA